MELVPCYSPVYLVGEIVDISSGISWFIDRPIYLPDAWSRALLTVDRDRLHSHFSIMSTQELTNEAMALPLSARVSLAQELWQSIDAGLADTKESDAVRDAIRRDAELTSGTVIGRTHEEVMRAARSAVECA